MSKASLVRRCWALGCVLSLSLSSGTALAHVQFIAPPPEDDVEPMPPQTVKAGSTFKLKWEVLIEHDPTGFDLDLLPDGPRSTPVEIAHGLPVKTLEYDWQVPDMDCTKCVLRVTQRNTINDDYEGFAPVIISTTGGSEPGPSGGAGAKGGSSSGGSARGGTGGAGALHGENEGGAEPAGDDAAAEDGGCSAAGRAPRSGSALLLAALALGLTRRRRAHPRR